MILQIAIKCADIGHAAKDNKENKLKYLWDVPKFENRLYILKDILENYIENGQLP